MTSHGVARSTRVRTSAQRQADLEKIEVYRALDARLLAVSSASSPPGTTTTAAAAFSDPATLSLTADVLTRNPDHYTAWNVRRRCLTCGSLSRPSPGPSLSAPSKTSSAPSTRPTLSDAPSASSSAGTQLPRESRPQEQNGKSGTIVDEEWRSTAPEVPDTKDAPAGDTANNEEGGNPDSSAQQDERLASILTTIQSELKFTFPLIKANPKSYWIWSYRLWILQQAIHLLPAPTARRVWEEELGLVAMMLNKDQRNFHAWGYRRHLVRHLESAELEGECLAEAEFAYTQRKVNLGLSNFSAWHHRSRVIPRVLEDRGADEAARAQFMDDEFSLVHRALDVGPEDQSCWYYHQFLTTNITTPTGSQTICPALSSSDKVAILQREIAYIKDLLEDYDDDIKLAFEALMDCTIALSRTEGREVRGGERSELKGWLAKLRKLDPMRRGRWDDVEREFGPGQGGGVSGMGGIA